MPIEAPRLYLIMPPVTDIAAAAPMLEEALEIADVACVLVRAPALEDAAVKRVLRALAAIAAAGDAALLLDGDPKLAARAGADGVHVRGAGEPLRDALDSLKPERIVGAGALASRDDAMEAGEAGADYVMFGEAYPDGAYPAFTDTLDRTEWWAEIFNVPCVAVAPGPAEIGPLAAAGADFVALGTWIWTDPRGLSVALREATAALLAVAQVGGPALR